METIPQLAVQLAALGLYPAQINSGEILTPCDVSTPTNLNATYNNGTSGVGATLTNAGPLAAFSADGLTPTVNSRVLVYSQTAQAQNGIYVLTTAGSGSVAWVLTRASDFDGSVSGPINRGAVVIVIGGTINAGNQFQETGSGPFVVGTTPIIFTGYNNITAGTGLGKTGTSLYILNTTVTAGAYGNARKTLNATVNAQGQLTALSENLIFDANIITHANSSLILNNTPGDPNLLTNLMSIALTNASVVQLSPMNTGKWKGRIIIVINSGNIMTDAPYKIVAQDGATVIVPRLEIGEICALYVLDDATANGTFSYSIFDNEGLTRRALSGGNIGTDIPIELISNTVVEINNPSAFTASTIGTNGVVSNLQWWFKNNSAGNLTFTPTVSDLIDGNASLTLGPNESAHILCNGVQFETISLSRQSPVGYQTISLSAATTLSNPLSSFINVNPTSGVAANQHLKLPAANVVNSMRVGVPYIFQNINSSNNALLRNTSDGALLTIPPLGIFVLVLTDNSTANGIYDGYALNGMAAQRPNAVAITGGTIDNTPIGQTTPSSAIFDTCQINRNSNSNTDYYQMINADTSLNLFSAMSAFTFNSAATLKTFCSQLTSITNRTASAETATWSLQLLIAGSMVNALTLSSAGASVVGALNVTDAATTRTNIGALAKSGDTMTGNLILNADATLALQPVTYQQFLGAIAGFSPKLACKLYASTNFAATYSNGTAGVGATLTATSTGVVTIDSVAVALNDRVLFNGQTTTFQNGIYVCTVAGAVGVNAVFTRASDYDNSPAGEVTAGTYTNITAGTVYAGTFWYMTTSGTITIGSSAIVFARNDPITAGTGLTYSSPNTLAVDQPSLVLAQSQITGLVAALAALLPLAGGTLTGLLTLAAAGVVCNGANQTALTAFEEVTVTLTLTATSGGGFTNQTFNGIFRRIGKQAFLRVPVVSVVNTNGSLPSMTITGIPARFTPATTSNDDAFIQTSASTYAKGAAQVTSISTIIIFPTLTFSGTFAAATIGLANCQLKWDLN